MSKEELHSIWSARVAEYKESGQSVSAWCAEQGLKAHQMRYWLRKDREPIEQPMEWLPLDLSDNSESTVTIRVGQVVVDVHPGFDPKLLLSVVKTLLALC
jgi:hypothetical protein